MSEDISKVEGWAVVYSKTGAFRADSLDEITVFLNCRRADVAMRLLNKDGLDVTVKPVRVTVVSEHE